MALLSGTGDRERQKTTCFMLRKYRAPLRKRNMETKEREKAERALHEKEELYRAVIENVADGITLTVGNERVFVNPAFLAIHGIKDPSEIIGQPFDQFIVPEDREAVKERVHARQRGDKLDKIAEYRIFRSGGDIRTIQASVQTVRHGGKPATLAVLRDITEIKQAEMKIRELNGELEQHVRNLEIANSDLEAFNSMVSHDLRIPLVAIQGFSRRVADKYGAELDKRARELVGLISNNAERMRQLIDDLLAYSRLGREAIHQDTIPMKRLIESVLDDLAAVYSGGDVIVWEVPDGVGDERLVRQVVNNLLSNALKFSKRRERRRVEVGGWQGNGEKVYSVADNGVGFDMAQKEKMFDIFHRLHGSDDFEGTGVGLAIVKRIVNLHGGRVWAEGKPDGGAVFYFTLPDPH